MTSPKRELNNISTEVSQLSLRRCQLQQRKKLLPVLQELRDRGNVIKSEGDANRHEIDGVNANLRELSEREAGLQRSRGGLLRACGHKDVLKKVEPRSANEKTAPQEASSSLQVFFVQPPPTTSAPVMILDVNKLPPCPSLTQCPACCQNIITETSTSSSSVTWMVCCALTLTGCVAGCCLLPFCIDRFKSITHKCPKCRTSLVTIKPL